MTDPFKKVSPGSALEIPADTWNFLLSSAQVYQRQKIGTGSDTPLTFPINPANTCLVQNMTGAALPAGAVLAYGTPLITPAVSRFEAQKRPAFEGSAPTTNESFMVTWDALASDPPNDIGRAIVSGLAVVQVFVIDESHRRARPIPGNTSTLESTGGGGVPIVWRESGTGVKWAFILLDHSVDNFESGSGASMGACCDDLLTVSFTVVTDVRCDGDNLVVTKETLFLSGRGLSIFSGSVGSGSGGPWYCVDLTGLDHKTGSIICATSFPIRTAVPLPGGPGAWPFVVYCQGMAGECCYYTYTVVSGPYTSQADAQAAGCS